MKKKLTWWILFIIISISIITIKSLDKINGFISDFITFLTIVPFILLLVVAIFFISKSEKNKIIKITCGLIISGIFSSKIYLNTKEIAEYFTEKSEAIVNISFLLILLSTFILTLKANIK